MTAKRLTLADARAAEKLYGQIAELDALSASLRNNIARAAGYRDSHPLDGDSICRSPLEVTFAHHTPCFSGPSIYRPNSHALSIAEMVMKDMAFRRSRLIHDLEELGFKEAAKGGA